MARRDRDHREAEVGGHAHRRAHAVAGGGARDDDRCGTHGAGAPPRWVVHDRFAASARALVDDGTINTLDDLNDYLACWLEEDKGHPQSSTKRAP